MSDSYHGTPITPDRLLEQLTVGVYCFCVSYWRPDQIELVCKIARKVMIDCGAFSIWMANRRAMEKWIKGGRVGPEPVPAIVDAAFRAAYYVFCRVWLAVAPPGSWFVIFDEIDAGSQVQDALLDEVPEDLLPHAWPVWHMDEPVDRAIRLLLRFGRCCIGSTGEFITVGSPDWRKRMDELFNAVAATFYGPGLPPLHMLRGLQCQMPDYDYPFDRMDSTNLGRNHNRMAVQVGDLAGMSKQQLFEAALQRWEMANCPRTWPPLRLAHGVPRPAPPAHQPQLFEEAA